MELYLIRHADALAKGDQGIIEDEERPLSEAGQQQAARLGKFFKQKQFSLDRIYTSPLVRARETAETMFGKEGSPEIEICSYLAPSHKPRKIARFLLKQGGEKVALVGHMPLLAELAAWLIGGKNAQIHLAKTGILHIVCGEAPGKGLGSLVWLVTPEWYSV